VYRNGLQSLISGLKSYQERMKYQHQLWLNLKLLQKIQQESLGAPKNKIVKIKDIR
jgi:hypothetical protein